MEIYLVADYKIEGIENALLKEAIDFCKVQKELSLDIETTRKYEKGKYDERVYKPGLDPYLSTVIMIQIGTLDTCYVIDSRCYTKEEIEPLFQNAKETLYVLHNAKFEAKMLKYHYGWIFTNIWDTMLVEQNLKNGLGWSKTNHKGLRFSLAALAGRYLGVENKADVDLFNPLEEDTAYVDKTTRMGFLYIEDRPFTRDQILYGSDDILYPLQIKKLQEKGYKGWNPTECHNLENSFCLVLADIELAGMKFDPKQWLTVYEAKKLIYEHRLAKINTYVEKNYPSFVKIPDLFDSFQGCSIMWSSSDQVIEFFRCLGFCPKEKSKQTKKMEFTVGAKALTKLLNSEYKDKYMSDIETDIKDNSDIILNYLLLKKSEQAVTTFGEDWLKHIHPITGRIHTSFTQILNTGRISSKNPNVQNIPLEEEYRKAFIGNLVNCDYSSQESRVLAEVCGDKDMLSFFNDGHPIFGDDYHSFTGTKMFRIIRNDPELLITKKTHPKERTDAKNISFKIAYGGSAYTLKDDFGVDEEVAQEFIDGYFLAFPSLKEDFEKAKADVLKKGYIEIDPITKRRWFDPNFYRMNGLTKKAWSYFPENYRTLGTAERIEVKKALYAKHPEVKEIWSEYFSLKGKLERNALNYRIQGLAGGQLKRSGILFRERQIEQGLQNKIWLTSLIHDESLAEVAPGFEDEGVAFLESAMVDGAQSFCKQVKMKAEAASTTYWWH